MERQGLLHELRGVVCPSCGRETPVEPSEGDSEIDVPAPHPSVIAGGGEPAEGQEWMVLKENGKVYGPFATEIVNAWIEERKINASEEVSPDGLEWWSFGEHEEFAHLFEARLSGIKVPESKNSDLRFRKSTPFRDFFRGLLRFAAALAFVAGVALGVQQSIERSLWVVPEPWIQAAERQLFQLLDVDKVPDEVAGPGPSDLLIEEIQVAYPERDGSARELVMRGRNLFLEDTNISLRAARSLLEQAVALDPGSGLALSALAELYNILAARGLGERDLQRKSIYLLERATASSSWQAERLRARATFLVHSDDPEEVGAVVQEALALNPRDPQLYFLLGLAAQKQGAGWPGEARKHFDQALELDPGFHGVFHQLGLAEDDQGQLWRAAVHFQRKIELAPSSPKTLYRLGWIYERLGQPQRAAEFYEQALIQDPLEKDAVLRRAVLAYQLDGHPERAVKMLNALRSNADLIFDIRGTKELLIHLSAASRLAGDLKGALEAADKALDEDSNYAPALFHKALALTAAGRPQEALPLYSRADQGGLENWTRARILFAEGRSAQAADQPQDAVDAYERALDAYPAYLPAIMWRADVRLGLGDAYMASKELCRHLEVDPLDYARERVAGLYYDPLPALEALALRVLSAAGQQKFAPQLHAAAGVLLFHDGRFDQAERLFNKALGQDERNETARFYRALTAHQRGAYGDAVARLDRLIELGRDKATYQMYRGDSLLALRRWDAAAESLSLSFALGVRSAWAHGRLAQAYVALKRMDEARSEVERGLALDASSCALAASRFQSQL